MRLFDRIVPCDAVQLEGRGEHAPRLAPTRKARVLALRMVQAQVGPADKPQDFVAFGIAVEA